MTVNQKLVVVIDGQSMLEYDRSRPLPGLQRRFLDQMDQEMDQGITLGGSKLAQPDLASRAQFVALNLIQAVQDQEEQKAAAMCSYLANRLPDLKQVVAVVQDGEVAIDLVFDRAYVPESKVEFVKPAQH